MLNKHSVHYHLPQFRKLQVGVSVVSKKGVLILQIRRNHPGYKLQGKDKRGITMQGPNIYRCIFLNKWAEGWVREEGFITWQLEKAFLLAAQKLPARVALYFSKETLSPSPRPLVKQSNVAWIFRNKSLQRMKQRT